MGYCYNSVISTQLFKYLFSALILILELIVGGIKILSVEYVNNTSIYSPGSVIEKSQLLVNVFDVPDVPGAPLYVFFWS